MMMMNSSYWMVFAVILVMISVASSTHVQPIQERETEEVPEGLRELLLIRRIISGMRDADLILPQQPLIRKRTCYLNAGLSHGCDYKDLVGAMAEKSYWDSLSSPGRRRRRRRHAPGGEGDDDDTAAALGARQ